MAAMRRPIRAVEGPLRAGCSRSGPGITDFAPRTGIDPFRPLASVIYTAVKIMGLPLAPAMIGYPAVHAQDIERVHRVEGCPAFHFIGKVNFTVELIP
jgi:hypothetical protein